MLKKLRHGSPVPKEAKWLSSINLMLKARRIPGEPLVFTLEGWKKLEFVSAQDSSGSNGARKNLGQAGR